MKKQIQINGIPIEGLQIGSPAVILENEYTRCTSTVLAIYEESKNKTVFETENTVYILQYPESTNPRRFHAAGKCLIRKLAVFRSDGCI